MKIAVISDIHENSHNLVLFLKEIPKHDIQSIVFLGDFINNGIAKALANAPVPVRAVWGNNDGGKVAIIKTSLTEGSNLTVGLETFDFLEIDNRKIFLTHYPMLAKPMAKSGDFDAVFFGHDHLANQEKINDCLLLNPGEISAHITGLATFAVYDTTTNSAEIFTLAKSRAISSPEASTYLAEQEIQF